MIHWVERDALADGAPVFRPGVPQSRHEGEEFTIRAGLVVVAGGRSSRTAGWLSQLGRMQQDDLARVLAAANTDPVVAEAFFAVLSLNRPPQTLLAPRIATRALRDPSPRG
ncbi:hypothetical protein OG211_35090 [Streptomyces niveus]|uniref:hypothetical protein n=1 Tax=Streptomyces niveus TaxID=193462 RepID=UPI0038651DEE|nr:hypothetical protein OG211_35090 [Streptomyces niveus]